MRYGLDFMAWQLLTHAASAYLMLPTLRENRGASCREDQRHPRWI